MDKILNIEISFSDGYYIAECDAIHLITESRSLGELKKHVYGLIPDLIDLNNLDIDINSVDLVFSM